MSAFEGLNPEAQAILGDVIADLITAYSDAASGKLNEAPSIQAVNGPNNEHAL